jgi:hypothetical protein
MRRFSAIASLASLWLATACDAEPRASGAPDDASVEAGPTRERPDARTGGASFRDGCAHCSEATADREARGSDATPPSRDAATSVGAASDTGPDRVGVVSDGRSPASGEEAGPPGYPPGPYGTMPGDTLPFLRWQGYVASEDGADAGLVASLPWMLYSTDDMRRSGKTLALFHLSDFDCPGCRRAGMKLAAGGPSLVDAGGLVVEVLGSRAFSSPAERADLDAWVASYDFETTALMDADGHALATLNAVGVRDTALVVQLPELRILWRFTGDLSGVTPTSAEAGLDEMHRRLGR